MIKIICDKCEDTIIALSNKPNVKKGTGIELDGKHFCSKCLCSALDIDVDGKTK